MITFSRFGKMGNLGNQMFQLASMIGMAKKYGQELRMPNWMHKRSFNGLPYIISETVKGFNVVHEGPEHYHYTPEHWDRLATGNWDVSGWLQTEKHWEHAIDEVKTMFTWDKNFLQHCVTGSKITDLENSIAISVRRGDYVGNPNYDLLPVSYYMQALMKEFPDYLDRQILIFSDDIPYCKIHFEGLPKVVFVEHPAMVQLCLMSQCGGFVIANSTFSWWGAYLAELRDPSVKIVRPNYLFAGPLLERSDSRDHWPERWVVYDHKENGAPKKYDLRDVTFTIPVMYDHLHRRQNLDLNVCLLQRVFDTNIMIGEMAIGDAEFHFDYMQGFGCQYTMWRNDFFHRTKMLNEMAYTAGTPIVANWDADVAVPEVQTIVSVELIRKGLMDGVYPYDGRFARVIDRKMWFPKLEKELDLGIYKGVPFQGSVPPSNSVGGAVIWNRTKFFEGGGENENFISHAPEDTERYNRFRMLGYRIVRVRGQLFHMDHWVGPNSSNRHGHKTHNDKVWAEFDAIRISGDVEKLWEYVKAMPNTVGVTRGKPFVYRPGVWSDPEKIMSQ